MMTFGLRATAGKDPENCTVDAANTAKLSEALHKRLLEKSKGDELVQSVMSKRSLEGDVWEIWATRACVYVSVRMNSQTAAGKLQQKLNSGELERAFEAVIADDVKRRSGVQLVQLTVTQHPWDQEMCLRELLSGKLHV